MDNEEKLDAHGITKPLYDIYYIWILSWWQFNLFPLLELRISILQSLTVNRLKKSSREREKMHL